MASTFKNAGGVIVTTDDNTANVYTVPGGATAVLHAVFISNKNAADTRGVDIKVTTDGGSTFATVLKSGEIPPYDTLQLDKPINLESGDILRIVGSGSNMESFVSILELT